MQIWNVSHCTPQAGLQCDFILGIPIFGGSEHDDKHKQIPLAHPRPVRRGRHGRPGSGSEPCEIYDPAQRGLSDAGTVPHFVFCRPLGPGSGPVGRLCVWPAAADVRRGVRLGMAVHASGLLGGLHASGSGRPVSGQKLGDFSRDGFRLRRAFSGSFYQRCDHLPDLRAHGSPRLRDL